MSDRIIGTVSAHLEPGTRFRVCGLATGSVVVHAGDDLSLFIRGPQSIGALRHALDEAELLLAKAADSAAEPSLPVDEEMAFSHGLPIEAEPVIDPDCRDGKCASCAGGPCEHECHNAEGGA
jgi:hypothetical protein